MTRGSRAKELAGFSFLVVFANDDTIDENELLMLEKLALEDHEVDEDEKRVLRNIFSRISRQTVVNNVWDELERFRTEHDI